MAWPVSAAAGSELDYSLRLILQRVQNAYPLFVSVHDRLDKRRHLRDVQALGHISHCRSGRDPGGGMLSWPTVEARRARPAIPVDIVHLVNAQSASWPMQRGTSCVILEPGRNLATCPEGERQ